MGNVNVPTPVALAGAALCILGGYLAGWVSAPDTPGRTTATVDTYDPGSDKLCLSGDSIGDQEGVTEDGVLCGTWRHTDGTAFPQEGDAFRFVSMVVDASHEGESGGGPVTVIYGDVVH